MNLTVDFWQLASFGVALVGAFWALIKIIVASISSGLDTRFTGLSEQLTKVQETQTNTANELRKLEKEFMALKAEMPVIYVMRSEHNKDVAMLMVRLDQIALQIQNWFLKGVEK